MQAIYQLLRKLTLPANAGNGARIVLDGTTDAILIYNSSNQLVDSLAATAGFDQFGNNFLAGYTSYDRITNNFINVNGDEINLGSIVGGQPTFTGVGFIQNNGNIILQSQVFGAFTDAINALFASGIGGSGSGSGSNPALSLSDTLLNTPVDLNISGNVIKTQNGGTRYTNQTPTMAAGFTNISLKYRLDAFDNVVWTGTFVQTTGAAGPSGAVATVAVPSVYRPAVSLPVDCTWESTASVAKGSATIVVNSTGTLSLLWPAATANGDKFSFSASIPLGNIP